MKKTFPKPLLVALALSTILLLINADQGYHDSDEGWYAAAAEYHAAGYVIPMQFWDPQTVPMISGMFFVMFGSSELVARLPVIIFSLATLAVFWLLLGIREERRPEHLLVLLLLPIYFYFSRSFLLDIPAAFWTVLTAYLFFKNGKHDPILAGVAAGIGIYFKYTVAFYVLPLFLLYLWRRQWKSGLIFAASAALIVSPLIALYVTFNLPDFLLSNIAPTSSVDYLFFPKILAAQPLVMLLAAVGMFVSWKMKKREELLLFFLPLVMFMTTRYYTIRWLAPLMPFYALFIIRSAGWFSDKLKVPVGTVTTAFVVILLMSSWTTLMVPMNAERDAALFVKERAAPNDRIGGDSISLWYIDGKLLQDYTPFTLEAALNGTDLIGEYQKQADRRRVNEINPELLKNATYRFVITYPLDGTETGGLLETNYEKIVTFSPPVIEVWTRR